MILNKNNKNNTLNILANCDICINSLHALYWNYRISLEPSEFHWNLTAFHWNFAAFHWNLNPP